MDYDTKKLGIKPSFFSYLVNIILISYPLIQLFYIFILTIRFVLNSI